VKLLLLGTSIAFWMYCTNVVHNLLVGILMFEIFHDVQYLSIVWVFNRKRAQDDPAGMGRLTRAVFGTRRALMGLYVGMVFAYGSLYFFEMRIDDLTPVFGGVLAASALLHFYYDGFIWKVRERSTRQALGLEGGQELRRTRELVPGFKHALKWSPFVAVVAALAVLVAYPRMSELQARVALADAFPRYDVAQANLGVALYANDDLDGAIEANRRALALDPKDVDLRGQARNNLCWALEERAERYLKTGAAAQALPLAREAAGLEPRLPDLVSNKATELLQKGDVEGAVVKYRTALLVSPEHPQIHMNLALALAAGSRLEEALVHARTAQRGLPQDAGIARLVERLETVAPPRVPRGKPLDAGAAPQ
jgi:tetratricopeptide (TPR) repeat protein